MREVNTRRLDTPRRCTTQPPAHAGDMAEHFKPGYLELPPEVLERLISFDDIEQHYVIDEQPFARGKYATVRRARHKSTGQIYAAKYLRKRRRSTDLRYEILHEIAVLHACASSTRIVCLYQVFETAHEMVLILEMASGGELQMLLDKDEIIEETTVKKMMRQILDGLVFLHSIQVAHLDIKPQNLVLTGTYPDCDVKLCDFGISRYIKEGTDIREILGTPDYVAPEVLNYESISLATDMWSMGVLLYVLLTGCSPFGGDTKQETFCNISRCHLDFPEDLFEEVSMDAQDLIKRLIVKEPSKRLTSSECLQHPWFQNSDLPKLVPSTCTPDVATNILVRTPESARKTTEDSIRRTPSIKRTPECSRKTIECIRRTDKTEKFLNLFKAEDMKYCDNSFDNRRQASMRLTRKPSFEIKNISKKRQTSFREKRSNSVNLPNETFKKPDIPAILNNTNLENETTIEDNNNNNNNNNNNAKDEKRDTRKQNLKQNLAKLAKRFSIDDDTKENVSDLSRKGSFKKAVPTQTMPSLYRRQVSDEKSSVLRFRRVYLDDDLSQFSSQQTAILIQVPASGHSSMSSISGNSSETSSITSDTVSEMSVDSNGDCSSIMSSDDSLDYIFRSVNRNINVWDVPKQNKVWIRECNGSFARALNKFTVEAEKPKLQSKMFQKNTNFNFNSLNRKSMYTSSPILNKISNLSYVSPSDCRKSGLELMREENGNLIVIRELKGGRYSKFSEVKCESLQSRIKKLQNGGKY